MKTNVNETFFVNMFLVKHKYKSRVLLLLIDTYTFSVDID